MLGDRVGAFSLFLSRSIVCDVVRNRTNISTRPMNVKKSQFMNSLNYCITQCTCTAFLITQIQMLYNGDQCHFM